MADGATVAALGPVVLPMADLTNVHVWKIGLATAFGSSFANALIVGTPNNAIAFTMCRGPRDRRAPDGGHRLHQVRRRRHLHRLGGDVGLGRPGLLAVPDLAGNFLVGFFLNPVIK